MKRGRPATEGNYLPSLSRPRQAAAPGSCAHRWEVETASRDGIADAVCTLCGTHREHIAQWERLAGAAAKVSISPSEPYLTAWMEQMGYYDRHRRA